MAIKGVIRSSMMQLRVLDLAKAVEYYTQIIGLDEICKTSDGRVCLKGYDEFDHHSLVLREAKEAGMDFMGWKVESDAYLDVLAKKTQAFGLECSWIAANTDQPGFGRRLRVQIPTGHTFDFHAEVEQAPIAPPINNPDVYYYPPRGIGVFGFDHALLYGPNSAKAVQYCREVMELGLVEQAFLPDGKSVLCSWLSGNNRAHDVAILEYDKPGKLHHIGFRLEDWSAVGHAADIISINDVPLDAGPMRHGITRGKTIYFFDPSGNRNEVYADGYPYFPDMPTRKWDFDHIGKGVFYYTRELNDRFLAVVT